MIVLEYLAQMEEGGVGGILDQGEELTPLRLNRFKFGLALFIAALPHPELQLLNSAVERVRRGADFVEDFPKEDILGLGQLRFFFARHTKALLAHLARCVIPDEAARVLE